MVRICQVDRKANLWMVQTWPSQASAYSHTGACPRLKPLIHESLFHSQQQGTRALTDSQTWLGRCPADVQVNDDIARNGGPSPPARGTLRAEIDSYICRKCAAKLGEDEQGRAKGRWCLQMFSTWNLDVWDLSKSVDFKQQSWFGPENLGNKFGTWPRNSRIWPVRSGIRIWSETDGCR